MPNSFKINEDIVARVPRFPQSYIDNDLTNLIKNKEFLEAIYVASPSLYNECIKIGGATVIDWRDFQKIRYSLIKYLYRMSDRSTPFGLFSACFTTKWGEDDEQISLANSSARRHVRLDMYYLHQLSDYISTRDIFKDYIKYSINTSLYSIADEERYIEYAYMGSKRLYQISSVKKSGYLNALIRYGKDGGVLTEYIDILLKYDPSIMFREARAFIIEIIDNQILQSELLPSITCKDNLKKIINSIANCPNQNQETLKIRHSLEKVSEMLDVINKTGAHGANEYQKIISELKQINVPFEEGLIFHVDLYFENVSGGVNVSVKEKIATAFNVLNRLTPEYAGDNLRRFISKYKTRYDEREMPLLEVLDTETGIGYVDSWGGQDVTPLVDDLILPRRESASKLIKWGEFEKVFYRKLRDCKTNVIEIEDKDLSLLPEKVENLLPSMSMMFRILSQDVIYVETCSGSSAVNLLARFCHGNDQIHKICRQITKVEQSINNEVIFAEILHVPDERVVNILQHPPIRDYEIPYLSKPSGISTKISCDDLFVSIRNERIVLRSKKMNKKIIPRLSNAHNYSHNALPVYQFLCDIQNQGKVGAFYFSWRDLKKIFSTLPRVSYQGIILSPAQWNIDGEKLQGLNAQIGVKDKIKRLHEIRSEMRIPEIVVLADGDNELLINFSIADSIESFIDLIKKRNSIILKEHFASEYGVLGSNGQHNNQFIAFFENMGPSYLDSSHNNKSFSTDIKRSFYVGEEWMYLKFYCGARSADKILTSIILPLVKELKNKRLIKEWFFIRYNDPDFHIRFRVHLTQVKATGEILNIFRHYNEQSTSNGLIWKIQNDTYIREIERYGSNTIELVEKLFHLNSTMTCEMLASKSEEASENVRWLWALKAIDEMLKKFGLNIHQKHGFIESLRSSFAAEFSVDKFLKLQIDQKFRQFKPILNSVLDEDRLLAIDPELFRSFRIIYNYSDEISSVISRILRVRDKSELEVDFYALLSSLVHMAVNRATSSHPRLHELIIYDFLSRIYWSDIARSLPARNTTQLNANEIPAL